MIVLYCMFLYDYSKPLVTFFNYSAVTGTAQADGQSQLTSVPVSTRLCLFKLGSLPLCHVFPLRWGNKSTLPCSLFLDALSHRGWETDRERAMISICPGNPLAPSSAFPTTVKMCKTKHEGSHHNITTFLHTHLPKLVSPDNTENSQKTLLRKCLLLFLHTAV